MRKSPKRTRAISDLAVRGLKASLEERLKAVVLYGSRARGKSSPDSDWDLLVIAERLPTSPFKRHEFLTQSLPEKCRGLVSILARTRREIERQHEVPSLYLDIALDGQILYDVSGSAAKWLSDLRARINEAGLYRRKTPHGDIWRWRSPANRSHAWPLVL